MGASFEHRNHLYVVALADRNEATARRASLYDAGGLEGVGRGDGLDVDVGGVVFAGILGEQDEHGKQVHDLGFPGVGWGLGTGV